MSDDTTQPAHLGQPDYMPPTYEIAPEDHEIANAILAEDITKLPGAFSISGDVKFPDHIGLDGLPPTLRENAQAMMAQGRDEQSAILDVLQANSIEIRCKTGFDPSVSRYHHEIGRIAREHSDTLAELDRLTFRMAEVARWDNVDGQPRAVPVMGPAEMKQAEIRQAELMHKARLFAKEDGSPAFETQRRLDKALFESVEARKKQLAEIAVMREAEAQAEKMLHQEKVDELAKGLARNRRNVTA